MLVNPLPVERDQDVGMFREDFFYRLRSDVITVPPLRQRLAETQMHGFGGMVTIEVAGPGADATRVADRLRLFTLAPSLGGAESLVLQPCTPTHPGLTPAERARRGITDARRRLSIGLEDPADLSADLEQALA